MHFSASMTAVGRPEQLYSWWSDYTDGVIADSSFTKVERRIVSREGNSIVMDDVFSRPLRFVDRVVVTLLPPDGIVFHSDSRVWKVDGRYSFIRKGDLTEATVHADIHPQGIWRIAFALPFVKKMIGREFREDLKGHLEQFEADSSVAGHGGGRGGS